MPTVGLYPAIHSHSGIQESQESSAGRSFVTAAGVDATAIEVNGTSMCFHPSGTHRQALLLFVRGQHKDRKRFGFGRTLDDSVHNALLRHTFHVARQVDGVDLIVIRDGRAPAYPGVRYLRQRGTDFNTRFVAALSDAFSCGYERIAVVGGDIPTLQAGDIEQALAGSALTLGPTCDGGFYLAAMNRDEVGLFDCLPWRDKDLLSTLLSRIRRAGKSFLTITRRRDIDKAADARSSAGLLLDLVRTWLGRAILSLAPAATVVSIPPNRIPEPRFCSIPPPFFFV